MIELTNDTSSELIGARAGDTYTRLRRPGDSAPSAIDVLLDMAMRGRKVGLRIHAQLDLNDPSNRERICGWMLELSGAGSDLFLLSGAARSVAIEAAHRTSHALREDLDRLIANVVPAPKPGLLARLKDAILDEVAHRARRALERRVGRKAP